jgi:hypothetical protein
MARILYRQSALGASGATGVKGAALTNIDVDTNFYNLNEDVQTRVLSADYSDQDVLDKIKNVDGSGSGLDADLLDGLNAVSGATGASVVSRDSSGNFAAGNITAVQFNGPLYLNTADSITFEGSVADGFETTLSAVNPTADITVLIPAVAGTLVSTGASGVVTNGMLAGSIANTKLANNNIVIDGNTVNLGDSYAIVTGNNTFTGAQTFRDNKFAVTDNSDTSRILNLELSSISTSTTRTLTIPDENGTVATREYVQTTGKNSQGSKTVQAVSAGTPSNSTGDDGDIIYQY